MMAYQPQLQSISTSAGAAALPSVGTPSSRVELTLSARNLADMDLVTKSDPLCLVEELRPSVRGAQCWIEVGRTECIDNQLNPEWNKKVAMDYFFESNQQIRFRIFDVDSDGSLDQQDFLGEAECVLADIVAAPDGLLVVPLKNVPGGKKSQLHVHAEELKGLNEIVQAIIHGRSLDLHSHFFPFSLFLGDSKQPFLEFYRLNADGSRHMVLRTENGHSKNPEWRPFSILARYLATEAGGGQLNKDAEFLVELKDFRPSGSHRLVGWGRSSLNKLVSARSSQQRVVELKKPSGGGESVGELRFVQFDVHQEFTFLDFIASGLQLEFAVAIDFTASNGAIHDSQSLHYCSPSYPNQYEMATRAVLDIVQHYNRSKQFEATGFGANVSYPGINRGEYIYSDFFPLRLDSYEQVVGGVEGVMAAYRVALNNSQLYGPTNFAPTIHHYYEKVRLFPRDGSRYQVLLFITDGLITDMAKTKLALIAASEFPISVIIIGVGNADFDKMDTLDSDDRLLSSGGRTAKRDIVQFVPFRNFLGAAAIDAGFSREYRDHVQAQLAKEVLAELPQQVTGWMKANGVRPRIALGGQQIAPFVVGMNNTSDASAPPISASNGQSM